MAKPKYPASLKIKILQEYLDGKGTYREIASRYSTNDRTLRTWMGKYEKYGEVAFGEKEKNSSYSSDFKIKCVEAVLLEGKSIKDVTIEHDISSDSVLRSWIKSYNANRSLKNYTPNKEVYMAEARRKTTLTERLEIVEYCLKHGQDYKNTASIYDVSYNQVYSWVKKYNKSGENALIDNRGHHKTDEEVDELEKLRRENVRLKKRLKEKERLTELLKKAREFERM